MMRRLPFTCNNELLREVTKPAADSVLYNWPSGKPGNYATALKQVLTSPLEEISEIFWLYLLQRVC